MIEFHCPGCDRLLRAPEDKAGARTRCPSCGETLHVPDHSPTVDDEPQPDPEPAAHPLDDLLGGPRSSAAPIPPPAAEAGPRLRPCPVCGEQIEADAAACRFCGEDLTAPPPPEPFEAGDIVRSSWEIYQKELGTCFGAFMIKSALPGVVAFPVNVIAAVLENVSPEASVAWRVLCGIPLVLFGVYLQAGYWMVLLKVARGEPADPGDVFKAGRFMWRMLGNSILWGLMFVPAAGIAGLGIFGIVMGMQQGADEIVALGAAGVVVGPLFGAFLLLRYWPYAHLLVDRDLPGTRSLALAPSITRGTYGQVIVLAIIAAVINGAALMACCLGILLTQPFTDLVFTTAYCRMVARADVEAPAARGEALPPDDYDVEDEHESFGF